jgi:glycosyltransferase involved in cell wall biosynthesis
VLVRGDSQLSGRRTALTRLVKAVVLPRLLRRFDGCLYVGRRNREYLEHYGVPQQQLFFSPHCIDNDAFRRASDAVGRRKASDGTRRILFAGKLIQRKRPLDVLDAAALLRRRGVEVEVAFAGSGELEDSLKRAASAAGVPAKFHGFVNQSALPGKYASADMLVLPSDGLETWGLVVNEAMACGVPAVVSDAVGCGPDLIERGRTGMIFPLGDIPALAGAMEAVLGFDRDRTHEAIAARMAVYSPSRAAQGIVDAAVVVGGLR